jgi:putative transcriptional regulator
MRETHAVLHDYSGKLLVAHPDMESGFFAGSVVYVYQHDHNGSSGIVLNAATTCPVSDIMLDRGFDYAGGDCVFKGGPVNQTAIVLLHSSDWYSSNTKPIGNSLAISSDNFMFEKIAMGNEPTEWRLFAGICAWAPGQLEVEINSPKGWQIAQPNNGIVFDSEYVDQWYKALQLCGQQLFDSYI